MHTQRSHGDQRVGEEKKTSDLRDRVTLVANQRPAFQLKKVWEPIELECLVLAFPTGFACMSNHVFSPDSVLAERFSCRV
jgi:hypothetical protein